MLVQANVEEVHQYITKCIEGISVVHMLDVHPSNMKH